MSLLYIWNSRKKCNQLSTNTLSIGFWNLRNLENIKLVVKYYTRKNQPSRGIHNPISHAHHHITHRGTGLRQSSNALSLSSFHYFALSGTDRVWIAGDDLAVDLVVNWLIIYANFPWSLIGYIVVRWFHSYCINPWSLIMHDINSVVKKKCTCIIVFYVIGWQIWYILTKIWFKLHGSED